MRKLLVPLTLFLALAAQPVLANEEAESAYERATAVLRTGDLDAALAGFTEASEADPESTLYRDRIALLGRVKQLRSLLARVEKDDDKWGKATWSLRAFYLQHGIHGEAVALDERRFERFPTSATRIDLAESCMKADKGARSIALLAGLEREDATRRSDLILGICLARTGELDVAKALAERVAQDETGEPGELFERACLNCLVGDLDKAAAQLRKAFEESSAAAHPGLVSYAGRRADLAGLRVPAYAKVFESKPKPEAEETGCPGCADGTCGH